jgi:hypothetical protein
MPEFVLAHTQQWMKHFASEGHDPRPLAAGVEGAIYALGDGLVAKVWRDRRPAELVRMQSFYADVVAAGLPFSTPEILAVEEVERTTVTYERKLPGAPLQRRLGRDDPDVNPAAARCVIDVLRALATVPATAAMRHLPGRHARLAPPSRRPLRARHPQPSAGLRSPVREVASASGSVARPP